MVMFLKFQPTDGSYWLVIWDLPRIWLTLPDCLQIRIAGLEDLELAILTTAPTTLSLPVGMPHDTHYIEAYGILMDLLRSWTAPTTFCLLLASPLRFPFSTSSREHPEMGNSWQAALWFLAQRKMNGSRIILSMVLDQSRSYDMLEGMNRHLPSIREKAG